MNSPVLPSFDVTKVPIDETIDIMYIVHKTFKNATLFTAFLFRNFINVYVYYQLRTFIFGLIIAFTNKPMVWPCVHATALCIYDVIALRIDDVIAHRKSLENQFWFVCPHYGSI